MSVAHLCKKQLDWAMAAYRHALALNRKHAGLLAYTRYAMAYVRLGDPAVALLKRAMRLQLYAPASYL